MRTRPSVVACLLAAIALPALGASVPQRLIVVISDLHLGLGGGSPKEDFHWTKALRSFCDELSKQGGDRVDLVIAGDFLELWQQIRGVTCGNSPERGCKLEEMRTLAASVAAAHACDLAILGEFAKRGDNRVYVVPGNHDAALLLPRVWEVVAPRFGAPEDRVRLVPSGVWSSADGKVVAEHGHQIWPDVNLYDSWPKVDAEGRMIRPWGEWFVQRLYDAEEDSYPAIDNLVASSAGVKYRMKDRGLLGSVADFGRFLRFAAFETSTRQRAVSLPLPKPGEKVEWNLELGRKRGHRLFADALASDDPLRATLLDDRTAEAGELRKWLDEKAADPALFPDDEVKALCDQIAERMAEAPGGTDGRQLCRDSALLFAAQQAHFISRQYVMRKHLEERLKDHRGMRLFVFGHTHALETQWPLRVDDLHTVGIVNTGAFQRLIDDEHFRAEAAADGKTPAEELRLLTLDRLPPCYSAVFVRYDEGVPEAEVKNWIETPTGGRLGSACDPKCARISKKCEVPKVARGNS